MVDTSEYYGGTYPEPNEVYEEDPYDWEEDDYDEYYADEYHELEMLGEIQ